MMKHIFTAHIITGSGRGKKLGTPTINMNLDDVPTDMEEGIYACWAKVGIVWEKGALHYGPRPVFKDTKSCEVYLLDSTIKTVPETIDIVIVGLLRPVLDFPTPHDLLKQIEDDVAQSHAMLDAHGPPRSETADS